MHPMLNTAVKAARKAAAIINRASLDLDLIRVSTKGRRDFVTEVDRAAEDAIISILRGAYPSHAFLAEESSAVRLEPKPEYLWIIDPLDGTTNFIHGFPQYAVSIALEHRGQLTHGVVYDPTNNELFTTSRGRGAFLNDRRLRVSRRTRLDESLIGTGLPFRAVDQLDHYLAGMRRIVLETAGVRRAGSAALDLAYVAAGRLDGFWEYSLSPWDIAAGALLVIESGGLVSDPGGGSDFLDSGHVVCGNPRIHAGLLHLLADPHGGEARAAASTAGSTAASTPVITPAGTPDSTPAPAPPSPSIDASGTLSVNAGAAPRRVSRVRRSAT